MELSADLGTIFNTLELIYRVRKGEVGLAWENNEPVFFQEGIYEKDSPNFTFERCVSAGEKVITLGAKVLPMWTSLISL